MAPPTVTETVTHDGPGFMKMNTTPAMEEKHDDEMSFQVDGLSRGPNQLMGIPKFPSYHEHRKHILIHMAAVFRNWARVGFTEGISGHISVRDPEHGGLIWMNPIGKHFGLLNARDMVCLRISDGKIVGGNRARHNIHAICHAHTIAGRAWAAFGKPLDMIQQDICDLYGVLVNDNEYAGIVTADQEGQQIARALGPKGKAAILINHGLVAVGHTVDEASFLLGLLDRSCDIQLRVEAACAVNPGLKKSIIPHELCENNYRMAGEKNWLYEEAQPDITYEIEMAGEGIGAGLDEIEIDV